jgi:hypothetical protein
MKDAKPVPFRPGAMSDDYRMRARPGVSAAIHDIKTLFLKNSQRQ